MNPTRTLAGFTLAISLGVLMPALASAKSVCIYLAGDSIYQLAGLPKSDKPKLFACRILPVNLPCVASGFVNGSNGIIGISSMWSTHGIMPAGTHVLTMPVDGSAGTYVESYHGDAASANEFSGAATVVDCP